MSGFIFLLLYSFFIYFSAAFCGFALSCFTSLMISSSSFATTVAIICIFFDASVVCVGSLLHQDIANEVLF